MNGGESGGCCLLYLGTEGSEALSSLSKENPAANYPVFHPDPSPTCRYYISNTNFEHRTKALSLSEFPSPSWLSTFGTTGDYFCNPDSLFTLFKPAPLPQILSPAPSQNLFLTHCNELTAKACEMLA